MKKILIFLFLYMMCAATAYAHAGRTDAYGGHYDNETGEYHYHHGYPAHEHIDGVCPYDFDDQTAHTSGNSSTSTATPKPELHLETPDPLSPPIASVQETPSPTTAPLTAAQHNNNAAAKTSSFSVVPIISIAGIIVLSVIHRRNIKGMEKEHIAEIDTLKRTHKNEINNLNEQHIKEIEELQNRGNPSPKCPDGYAIGDDGLPYKYHREYGWGMEYNVYVTQHGHCYHTLSCKALKGKGKVRATLHRYDAVLQGYTACPHCNPVEGIDDWFVEMFPDSEYAELNKKNK